MVDKKTSEEVASATPVDADYLRAVSGGVNVKVTFGQIKTWMGGFVPFLGLTNTFLGLNVFTLTTIYGAAGALPFTTRGGVTTIVPRGQVQGTDADTSASMNARFDASSGGPRHMFAKSRNATLGAHTIVQSGDVLGTEHWGGSDGTNIVDAATIQAVVASAPGTNSMPTNVKFSNNRGASTPTFLFGMYSNGFLGIGSDLTPDAPITVNNNSAAAVAPFVTGGIHLVGANSAAIGIEIDSYGSSISFNGRRAQGTQGAKTAVAAGSGLFSLVGYGWDTANYTFGGLITIDARETFSGTAGGTSVGIWTTALTTKTTAEVIRAQPSGGFSVGAGIIGTDPGAGNLSVQNAMQMGSFTVATLPAGVNGRQVYCSNGRMYNGAGVLEGAGAGTGGMVSYNGAWKIVGTNQTVQA